MVRSLAIALALWFSGLCCAQDVKPPPLADEAWAQQSAKIINATPTAEQQAIADQAKKIGAAAAHDPQLQTIAKQAKTQIDKVVNGQLANSGASQVHAVKGDVYRIFVSQSLPDATIQAIMDLARNRPDVVVEVRGFTADQTMGAMVAWMRRFMTAKVPFQQVPDVEIDPDRFTQVAVTRVPAIAIYRDDKPIAWARGSYAVDTLAEKAGAGATGDLGVWGQSFPVVEQDLGKRLQSNFSKIDFAGMKNKAVVDFWSQYPFIDIPAATRDSVTAFDPSFVVNQDIQLPDGRFLAHKGDRVNPLDRLPFDQVLVAFDATSEAQRKTTLSIVRALGTKHRLTIMTTHLAQKDPMRQLNDLQAQMGWPVYVLNQQLQTSFHITTVPSIVTAVDRHFEVHAFVPGSEPSLTDEKESSDAHSHAPAG